MARPRKAAAATFQIPTDHNLASLKEWVNERVLSLRALEEERSSVNARMADIRSELKGKGVPTQALRQALWYIKAEADQRKGHDFAYQLVREAAGCPLVQGDLDLGEPAQQNEGGLPDGAETTH